jgi:hypothetical protein
VSRTASSARSTSPMSSLASSSSGPPTSSRTATSTIQGLSGSPDFLTVAALGLGLVAAGAIASVLALRRKGR